jgi:large subunit ribosomal protein L29
MTRATALRELNDDELAHHLVESREEMFHLRFQLALGKQDNSARLGQVRREVARVLTLIGERRAGGAAPRARQGRAAQPGRKVAGSSAKSAKPKTEAIAGAVKASAPASKAGAGN